MANLRCVRRGALLSLGLWCHSVTSGADDGAFPARFMNDYVRVYRD